ncbi:MAG TPA: PilX N-terminal domain-containing pilus assembly protein [Mariprofundaceae bacterium]|nr:PilX N-terminal domain-containing pilus assembly protein [Mariprofundaceae bacterium]
MDLIGVRREEKGTVLVLALVMLVVLAAMAVGAMTTSIQEQRMSMNSLDQNMAFQAAETALRVGEDYLQGFAGTTPPVGTASCAAPCVATPYTTGLPWGTPQADQVTTGGGASFANAVIPPQVIIEDQGLFITGISTMAVGGGYGGSKPPQSRFYHVTAFGSGMTTNSQSMVQSVYAIRAN